jgi:hypothetical protein
MLSHLPARGLVNTAASQVMPPVAMPSHLPAGASVITAASQVMLLVPLAMPSFCLPEFW